MPPELMFADRLLMVLATGVLTLANVAGTVLR